MNRITPIAMLLSSWTVACLATTAQAQPVFFDDFDGDALAPHWIQPFPEDWTYNVSNGMLNVTGLHYPSNQDSPSNRAVTGVLFPPLSDLRVDVAMGWESDSPFHRLRMSLVDENAVLSIASFGFRSDGSAVVQASVPGLLVSAPAPPSGLHQFVITRTEDRIDFYLDHSLFASLRDQDLSRSVGGIVFEFAGPYPGPAGSFHIDYVNVIPTPSTIMLLTMLLPMAARRKRDQQAAPYKKRTTCPIIDRVTRTRVLLACCVGASVATTAQAQPVFLDDFDGDALLPHWELPRPEDWTYNVSNGMLNVTGLHFPSNPDSQTNQVLFGAGFDPQLDFRLDVWMSWDATQPLQRLSCQLGPGFMVAGIAYRNAPGFGPIITASVSGHLATMPAPAPGLHHFTIARSGALFEFYVDGMFFTTLPDTGTITPAESVIFNLVGQYPGEISAYHIDRVTVVPAPTVMGMLFVGIVSPTLLRRRRMKFVSC